jgi:hypothetical protein
MLRSITQFIHQSIAIVEIIRNLLLPIGLGTSRPGRGRDPIFLVGRDRTPIAIQKKNKAATNHGS